MSVVATILCGLLGFAFLAAGLPKVLRTTHYRDRIRHWRLPEGLLPVIGLIEMGGAALLLVGVATRDERPAVAGALLLGLTMGGAVITHVRIADPPARALPSTCLGGLAVLNVALLAM